MILLDWLKLTIALADYFIDAAKNWKSSCDNNELGIIEHISLG